jgi:hypothetical protein
VLFYPRNNADSNTNSIVYPTLTCTTALPDKFLAINYPNAPSHKFQHDNSIPLANSADVTPSWFDIFLDLQTNVYHPMLHWMPCLDEDDTFTPWFDVLGERHKHKRINACLALEETMTLFSFLSFDVCSLLPMPLLSNPLYPKATKTIFSALSNPLHHQETMTVFSSLPSTHSCDQDDVEFITDLRLLSNSIHHKETITLFGILPLIHSCDQDAAEFVPDLRLDNNCLTKAGHIVSAPDANHFADMLCLAKADKHHIVSTVNDFSDLDDDSTSTTYVTNSIDNT